MNKLLCRHWRGWLNPDTMITTKGWFEFWHTEAKHSIANNNELVVIEIPRNSDAIQAIERLLQEKYPLNGNQKHPKVIGPL